MTMREDELRRCLVLANAGDEDAYRRFLGALLPVLRRLARAAASRTGMPACDTEDIVQETLIAVHLKRHTYNPDLPIGPWIRGIVRYKLLDALRRRRVPHVPLEEVEEWLTVPPVEPARTMGEVRKLAANLSRAQQNAVLAFAEGLTGQAAARRTAMTEGAFRVALHRGIHRLARLAEG